MTSPGRDGRPELSWADLLEACVSAMRDTRAMLLELNARAALLTETLDELVERVVDAHAAEIIVEDRVRAMGLDLRVERDPLTAELEREKLPGDRRASDRDRALP